jgi:hypothetical protein
MCLIWWVYFLKKSPILEIRKGDNLEKKRPKTIGEILEEAGKEEKKCNIQFANEPNFKLMAEAAINLYHQTY